MTADVVLIQRNARMGFTQQVSQYALPFLDRSLALIFAIELERLNAQRVTAWSWCRQRVFSKTDSSQTIASLALTHERASSVAIVDAASMNRSARS